MEMVIEPNYADENIEFNKNTAHENISRAVNDIETGLSTINQERKKYGLKAIRFGDKFFTKE